MSSATRPLPAVSPETEFFWRSGEDEQLRLQKCRSCSSLIHPPKPICPYCRGRETGVRVVSGRGTLFGFTENHRFALPGLTPPYIVAEVAVEEDPRVRLTTSVVESDAADLVLGMQMEVLFEHHEDVWLPLFRPSGAQPGVGALAPDEIDPSDYSKSVRPMV